MLQNTEFNKIISTLAPEINSYDDVESVYIVLGKPGPGTVYINDKSALVTDDKGGVAEDYIWVNFYGNQITLSNDTIVTILEFAANATEPITIDTLTTFSRPAYDLKRIFKENLT